MKVITLGRLKDRLNKRYYSGTEPKSQPQPQYNNYSEPQQPQEQYETQKPQYETQEPVAQQERTPLSILEEIKNNPTPKGTFPVVIQGVPVDLHSLEGYILKVSPYDMRTLQRFEKARLIEEIKNYARFGGGIKLNMKMILIILLAIGMAILGIILIFYMPQIMKMFQGGIGV